MKKILKVFKIIKNYIDGDFAYQAYLRHCKKNHTGEQILSRENFFRVRQKEKSINRCC